MKIRRFFAPDIRQAMRLVREAQGPDAVILSNRKVDGGVEIVAAVDFDETLLSPATSGDGASTTQATAPQAPSARVASQLGMFRTAAQATSEQPPATPSAPRSAPTPKPAAAAPSLPPTPRLPATAQPAAGVKSMTANLAAPTALNKPTASKPSTPTPTPLPQTATKAPPARVPSYNPPEARIPAGSKWPNVGNHINETDEDGDIDHQDHRIGTESQRTLPRSAEILWTQDPVLVDMRRELKELRGLLEHQLSGLAWAETTRRTPVQAQLLRALTEMGLTMSLARELSSTVSGLEEFDTAWRHTMGLLAERLTVEEDNILEQGGIIALVGATGVGKTTTVAKLAAHYALRHGRDRVALITTDGYRIGSQEQLRTFARILGVPMRAANDAAELSEILAGLTDCGLVLIDTAGLSQRDLRIEEQFATLRGVGREIRSYLVLSATTQRAGLEEVIRVFGEMGVAGCILTKLDEAASLGEVLSAVVHHKLPIAYLGIGQRVPEDLIPARAHSLVSRAVALLQNHVPDIEEESLAMAFGSTPRYAAAL